MRFVFSYIFAFIGLMFTQIDGRTMAQDSSQTNTETIVAEDPYQWLEDVSGEKSIEWVKARNEVSKSKLE